MKKIKLLFTVAITIIIMVAFALPVMAQDVPVPDDVMDVITNINVYFGSLLGVSVLTAFIAALLTGILKVEKKFLKQLIAWVVAIILIVVSDLLNYGFAADFSILKAIIYGLGAGLAANGIFDIPVIKTVLDYVDGWFKPSE